MSLLQFYKSRKALEALLYCDLCPLSETLYLYLIILLTGNSNWFHKVFTISDFSSLYCLWAWSLVDLSVLDTEKLTVIITIEHEQAVSARVGTSHTAWTWDRERERNWWHKQIIECQTYWLQSHVYVCIFNAFLP